MASVYTQAMHAGHMVVAREFLDHGANVTVHTTLNQPHLLVQCCLGITLSAFVDHNAKKSQANY